MKRREIGNLLRWLGWSDANDACASWTHLLSLYADFQATPKQVQRIEAHLATCAPCRASLALLRATTQVAQTWAEMEMPAGLSERLSLAIAEEARKQRVAELGASRSRQRRFGLPQIAYGSAAFAAIIVGAYFAETHHHAPVAHRNPVIAVNPVHSRMPLPGRGGLKTVKPIVVAVNPSVRHRAVPRATVVASLPHDEQVVPTERGAATPTTGEVKHPTPSVPTQASHSLRIATAIVPRQNALTRPHLKPSNLRHLEIAKAAVPAVSLPRDPGLPDDDESPAPSAPVAAVAASAPATADTPVLHLASTLRGLARGTQTIQPGTDQISVTMAHTANYTGAATIVGTSIH